MLAFGSLDLLSVPHPQAQAIASINEVLSDPKRATSDPSILAVGRMAPHESMYRDKHAAHMIHRPAQQQTIRMRGGMGRLKFPELVKRLMRWCDTVMAKQGGTQRFIEDDEEAANLTLTQFWRAGCRLNGRDCAGRYELRE